MSRKCLQICLKPNKQTMSIYEPFLWEMCFSGSPFLYGIHIFFSGFWVSSRGVVGVLSSIPSCAVLEAAAPQSPTRGCFPWCCSEGDRCFILAAPFTCTLDQAVALARSQLFFLVTCFRFISLVFGSLLACGTFISVYLCLYLNVRWSGANVI